MIRQSIRGDLALSARFRDRNFGDFRRAPVCRNQIERLRFVRRMLPTARSSLATWTAPRWSLSVRRNRGQSEKGDNPFDFHAGSMPTSSDKRRDKIMTNCSSAAFHTSRNPQTLSDTDRVAGQPVHSLQCIDGGIVSSSEREKRVSGRDLVILRRRCRRCRRGGGFASA